LWGLFDWVLDPFRAISSNFVQNYIGLPIFGWRREALPVTYTTAGTREFNLFFQQLQILYRFWASGEVLRYPALILPIAVRYAAVRKMIIAHIQIFTPNNCRYL